MYGAQPCEFPYVLAYKVTNALETIPILSC